MVVPNTPPRTSASSAGGSGTTFVGLNQPLSETVLCAQQAAALQQEPHGDDSMSKGEISVDLTEYHEALIGTEFRNPKNILKQPTLATLGETPFTEEYYTGETKPDDQQEEEVQHHRVVATEVVKDPLQYDSADSILQNAIVLLGPRLPECTYLIEAGKKRGLMVMAVIIQPNDGSLPIRSYPTVEALLEVGMHQVYEPPMGTKFDIIECASNLKTIESQQNLRFLGCVPCQERAVDFSDVLASLLGLTVCNDLGLASARRDKGLMKLAVANAGLRVAKYARLTQSDGKDVIPAVAELELEYPVVVKTPRGCSTLDVYICENEKEAVDAAAHIIRSVGPDGRRVQYGLLEEFIGGEEFAVNLMASPTTPRGVQVTDIWMYHKISTDGSTRI